MILSFSKNFIFLKAPKTAGTSVEATLVLSCNWDTDLISPEKSTSRLSSPQFSRYLSGFGSHICPVDIIKSSVVTQEQFDKIPKIITIRNPWEINVSRWWMHKMHVATQPWDTYKNLNIEEITSRYKGDFNKWVQDYFLTDRGPRTDEEIYWLDQDGQCMATYIIRYENLEEDFKWVSTQLGLVQYDLPKIHSQFRILPTHYSEYYTEETKQLISYHYQRTINCFGYKFQRIQ